MNDDDLERAIAGYRAELTDDVGLAADDVAELEDHLRALIDELRAAGRSADVAFAEAARRLGAPRALGREYARVHTVFGARLSRARAWSAAVVLAAMFATWVWMAWQQGWPVWNVDLGLSLGMIVVTAARRTWARALLVGVCGWAVFQHAMLLAFWDVPFAVTAWAVPYAGALAFLAPWRRGELTAAGWGLVLVALAYPAVASPWWSGRLTAGPLTTGVYLMFLAGAAAMIVRSRAAAILLAGVAIGLTAVFAWSIAIAGWFGNGATEVCVVVGIGVIASAAAARLAWRHAAPGLGSLRGILA